MNYLEAAEKIYYWLSDLQVRGKTVIAKKTGSGIGFSLKHPSRGNLEVKLPDLDAGYSRIEGIGLGPVFNFGDELNIEVYDDGGIWDPLDGFVPGDHYATTHFALIGAILYSTTRGGNFIEPIRAAINFHLRTSDDEYRFDSWYYHWDFQNYAFLETYKLMREYIDENVRLVWEDGLKKRWKQNDNNPLTNWQAMRAYSSILRHSLFGFFGDRLKHPFRMRGIYKACLKDGCFEDRPGRSSPIQYHAFTLAVLHRIYQIRPSEKLRHSILNGLDYLLAFVDPDGGFNHSGRGQEQIFGYGAAIYAFEAGRLLDEGRAGSYEHAARNLWKYLLSFQREDGIFPLVLNTRPDQERYGWYDYHHLTVYNAFLGAWLGLAHQISSGTENGSSPSSTVPGKVWNRHFPESGYTIVSRESYFAVFGRGMPVYSTEPGITPCHLWFKNVGWVFTCPGGPTKERFGKLYPALNADLNFFAPLASGSDGLWATPALKRCRIHKSDPDRYRVSLDYRCFHLEREVVFENDCLVFQDVFHFPKGQKLNEIRFIHWPVVVDKFEIDIGKEGAVTLRCAGGAVRLTIVESDLESSHFEVAEEIKTAKGMARSVVLRTLNCETEKNQEKRIVYRLERVS